MKNLYYIIILLLSSCEFVEYSPYDRTVNTRNANEENIKKIKHVAPNDTLCFVALADIHCNYNYLVDAVNKINQLSNISFVVVCGDITDSGLSKEFEWYYKSIEKLNIPFITIIGNHDYRSNGGEIYDKMFGSKNFSFDVGAYHFVAFDDVIWENNNTPPNFSWLNDNLNNTNHLPILFTHIPSSSDQFSFTQDSTMNEILHNTNTKLAIHGHNHKYSYSSFNNINYLVVGSIDKKELIQISLYDTSIVVNQIQF